MRQVIILAVLAAFLLLCEFLVIRHTQEINRDFQMEMGDRDSAASPDEH